LSSQVIFCTRALRLVAFLRKETCILRHPMHLRHSLSHKILLMYIQLIVFWVWFNRNLSLGGFFSMKLGIRDLEYEINEWDMRVVKWHSKCNRMFVIWYCLLSKNGGILRDLNDMLTSSYMIKHVHVYALIWIFIKRNKWNTHL